MPSELPDRKPRACDSPPAAPPPPLPSPPSESLAEAPDTGDLASRIDAIVQARVVVYHRGLDGQPHVTADALERLEADLLIASRRTGGACQ